MKYKYLLLPLAAVSATAGIAAAHVFWVLLLFLLYLLFIIVKTKHHAPVIVCLVSFCLYFYLYTVCDAANVTRYQAGSYTEQAVITNIPKVDGAKMSAVIRTHDKEKWAASYKIRSLEEKDSLNSLNRGCAARLQALWNSLHMRRFPEVLIIRNIFTLSRFTGYFP